jgi:hypothetical protein
MATIIGYVDPGTGATLMQLALAGTVGIGAIVRLKWNSIRSVFYRGNRGDDSSDANLAEASLEDENSAG